MAQALTQARKWKSELQLAGRRERDWREKAERIIKRYRGEDKRKNSFNILWANTEILRAALYNSRPTPDVRRRFRDEDPLGKAVSEVLERALYVVVDDPAFDATMRNDVLDMLLPGRGLSRLRYVASIKQAPAPAIDEDADNEDEAPVADEQLEYEQVCIEHVDWQDFRIGYGRVWDEVPWAAFRCVLTRDEAQAKFGDEPVAQIEFTQEQAQDDKRAEGVSERRKVAEFWEVWDKTARRVFFTCDQQDEPLYPLATANGEPPLELIGFFPCPEPLRIVENTGSLEPIPVYQLYEQQANELDQISARIAKIVDACKLRGIRDAKLSELEDLVSAPDNALVPVANAQAWAQAGGLEKAITWLPVEQTAKVLSILGEAREQAKQTIYEITGIADIIRGATAASETATAQQIKANFASVRLQRMQREVQRYVRDILRIAAEIIANKFAPETLAAMTNLTYPTQQQKMVAQQQMQMRAQGLAQSGQQPPPPDPAMQAMLSAPSWEDITGLMRKDMLRQFKVDVETDSTVAGSLNDDMQGMSQVVQALGGAMQVFAPAVQQGFLPLEAAKEIALAVVRRAKMGLAVEDALEKMQAPPPPQPPQDNSLQVAQLNAQKDQQIAQLRSQHEQQLKAAEIQAQAQADAAQKQHDAQIEQMRLQAESQRNTDTLANQRMIADAANQTTLLVAGIKDQQARDAQQAQLTAEAQRQDKDLADSQANRESQAAIKAQEGSAPGTIAADFKDEESQSSPGLPELITAMSELTKHMSAPKQVLRDQAGRIIGLQSIN